MAVNIRHELIAFIATASQSDFMTPRPMLAIVTEDLSLFKYLTLALSARFELIVIDSSVSLEGELRERSPAALLYDARNTADCGHAAARDLSVVCDRWPALPLVVLARTACPEPLERLLVCSSGHIVREPFSHQEVVHWLAELSRPASGDAPASPRVSSPPASTLSERGPLRFETRSARLKSILDDLAIAADHDVTILLIGETGSGKTYLSRLIHESSARRNEPFLHVACGALPRDLIESELFGHVKGAFTSAHADKDGRFVAAGRGTILLDEIDVLGPEQQVKLLRVIETGQFEPVGSNRTLHSQARLIVASNLELQPLVDQGRFRPDLYYRLNMLKFEIPPLRKRAMDVVPLAKQFIRQFQEKHGVTITRVDDSLLEALTRYPWPGNVRELENVIQRAVIYCRDGVLTARQLPEHIVAGAAGPANDPTVRLDGFRAGDQQSLGRQIALTEREIIEQALFQNEHSKTRAAKALGISRVTLYNKLKKLDIPL